MRTKTALNALCIAIAAGLSLTSFQADATDIRASNLSSFDIHPWFRSNCFAAPTPRNVWNNFGGIGRFSQFTWPQFEVLLDPACKHPVVEFTYTVNNMLPPLDSLPAGLASRVKFRSDMGLIGFHVVTSTVLGPDDSQGEDD
jgi:hypothetical protein